jgi:hypothetical protein
MGHQELQRTLVRMLYDDSFVAAVHAAPERALGNAGLDEGERAELLAVDRRAFSTDPLRRRRTLRILADEYKISSTLALAETRSLAWLEGYFSSEHFHAAVRERRAIALAYGDFLLDACERGSLRTPQIAGVVRLESAMARCRRDAVAPIAAAPGPAARVRLAPGHAVLALEANAIATVQTVEQYLFEIGLMPAVALCDDAPRPGALPPVSAEQAYLLLASEGRDVSLAALDADTYEMLRHFDRPRAVEEVATLLAARRVPVAAVRAAVEAFVEEGLLSPSR